MLVVVTIMCTSIQKATSNVKLKCGKIKVLSPLM
jgi:hypothetical protein